MYQLNPFQSESGMPKMPLKKQAKAFPNPYQRENRIQSRQGLVKPKVWRLRLYNNKKKKKKTPIFEWQCFFGANFGLSRLWDKIIYTQKYY